MQYSFSHFVLGKNKKKSSEEMTTVVVLLLLLLNLVVSGVGAGSKVSAIIVFGDSTVDAGNNNQIETLARCNFEPYGRDFEGGKPTGRFCNGRLVPDFVSELFGIKPSVPAYLDPEFSIKDFATGVTFASAATGYDNATSDVLSVIPLWKEVEYFREYKRKLIRYQGKKKAITTLRDAIYIISIGTNDFIENYYTPLPGGRSSEYTIEEYQSFLLGIAEKFLMELFRIGARKLSIAGIPAMGCLPLTRTLNMDSPGSCNEEYNKVAKEFSEKIKGLVAKLRNQVPGFKIVYTNCYDSLLDVVQRPKSYGFEENAMGCCGSGMFETSYACHGSPLTCTDANKYLFWDSIHGTEKLNGIIADYMKKTSLVEFL